MERACFGQPGGKLVTVAEFLGEATRDYKLRGIYPYCPACEEIVEIYGAHSTTVQQRFDHHDAPPNADPADDCSLANRGDARFKYLTPTDWDFPAGEALRREFLEDDNLKRAYSFCHFFCGKGNLPGDVFRLLLRRADKKNIWCYAGIHLWVVPYILLTLGDFRAVSEKTKREYGFHFIFEKPRGGVVDDLWLDSSQCRLMKVFSGSNELMKGRENPCGLSEEKFLEISGDTSWLKDAFLRSLKPVA